MKAYLYRLRFVVSVIAATVLPILITGIVLQKAAEQALLDEKKQKLIAITEQMDFALTQTYEEMIAEMGGTNASREEKIRLLNSKLEPLTNEIAAAHPSIGVGYYAKELDAILTYGPGTESSHVGKSIAPDHPGREVLRTRQPDVVIGQQVRGNIMNAMIPLIRDGDIIGYVWANELMSSIDVQLTGMRQSIYIILGIGCIVAAVVSGLLVHRLEVILAEIKSGLRRLSFDLSFRMKRLEGEPGEITSAINKLASDLQASRSHTETMMDSMENGVIALDQDGRLTAWNGSAASLTGLANEARGERYEQVFAHSPVLLDMIAQALQNAETNQELEWRHPHSERGLLYIKVSTSTWKGTMDEVLGVIVVLEDRTEWKQMEARLAQAERLAVIGEWATSIAHEVRNPLTSIKAFTQIIEEELPDKHDSREYTSIIMEEVERLNRFADELLMFSRPSEETHAWVNLEQVISRSVKLVQRNAAQKGISIRTEIPANLPLVLASPELLTQVFLNILLNALQAAPAGKKVWLETERLADHVCIHVSNEGSAIAKENLFAIFEPFFTTKPAGTGLGLAISQRIVQAYGGHIYAENIAEGVRFTVELPTGREEEGL